MGDGLPLFQKVRNHLFYWYNNIRKGMVSIMEQERKIPAHVAIILDGNGRWAKKKRPSKNHGAYGRM